MAITKSSFEKLPCGTEVIKYTLIGKKRTYSFGVGLRLYPASDRICRQGRAARL